MDCKRRKLSSFGITGRSHSLLFLSFSFLPLSPFPFPVLPPFWLSLVLASYGDFVTNRQFVSDPVFYESISDFDGTVSSFTLRSANMEFIVVLNLIVKSGPELLWSAQRFALNHLFAGYPSYMNTVQAPQAKMRQKVTLR